MIIKELSILDTRTKMANTFKFSDKANIITSEAITVGKSSLLKMLYHTLGFTIKRFNDGWRKEDMFSKIIYEHNGRIGYIIRSRQFFWVDGINCALDIPKYSEWLMKLFDISILLPVKQEIENRTVYASVLLLPYYVDQDDSWGNIPYKTTTNDTGMYDSNSIPTKIFEYLFNIATDRIAKKETILLGLNDIKKGLSQKERNLQDFKDDFIKESVGIPFDEKALMIEIEQYLKYANSISEKVQEFKKKIYPEQISLNALKLELSEVKEILNKTTSSYKCIKSECPTCGSYLTEEQTIKRMKLDNDKLELNQFKAALEKKIEISEKKISVFLSERLDLENEYKEITKITEKKQGDLTLQQVILEKAKVETKNIYVNVKLDLIDKLRDVDNQIENVKADIEKMRLETKGKRDNIADDFKTIMGKLALKFYITILNNVKFLEFTTLKITGTSGKIATLALYLAYFELLIKHSKVVLPFVLDSVIKEEPDTLSMDRIFSYIEDNLLKKDTQSFVSMLKDKLQYIKGDYKIIELQKPILAEDRFNEVHTDIENLISQREYNEK